MMDGLGPEIETARLRLRMFRPEDAETFHRLWNDPQVMKYIQGWNPTLEESHAAIARQTARWREKGFGQWVVMLKDEEKIIGYVGFKNLDKTEEVELIYGIDQPYWNRGITTEAARACLSFVFEHTPLDRIVAVAMPENTGSWRVMEKLGMKHQSVAHYYNRDLVYYAILRSEFEKQGGSKG